MREEDARATIGRHTAFKESLKDDLHKKLNITVKQRTGPSFDQRMHVASKAFNNKARALETEQRKTLQQSIERGRSRPTSAPIRPRGESPNQQAMLQERLKKMREDELAWKHHIEAIRHKMDNREPLFRLSDVQAGFEMLEQQKAEKKLELKLEEQERWEHLRAVEAEGYNRPLLIEDYNYRPPQKDLSASAPDMAADQSRPMSASGGRSLRLADNEFDLRIEEQISSQWFARSDWGRKVKAIKERADNREKLHEISYPQKVDSHKFTKTRLMHQLAASTAKVLL